MDIRQPSINAKTEAEQQIKSYLIQLAEQLNFALKNIDTSNDAVAVTPTPKSLLPSSQTTASAEAIFGSIKALIIKSADIINAYTEEISTTLRGEYVAESDFGVYREQTERTITENSKYSNQMFTNIQEIQGGLSDNIGLVDNKIDGVNTNLSKEIDELTGELQKLDTSIIEVTANIKTGLLYYDDNEVPIYGLEVGQKNVIDGEEVFNKFARFTADRLSFYDQNGLEVAYISDYRLYISDVEITSRYKIGGYRDTVKEDGGVITRWVGRS